MPSSYLSLLAAISALASTAQAAPATAGCRVSYALSTTSSASFDADVYVTNLGVPTGKDWTLTWSFDDGQEVSSSRGDATISQKGSRITAHAKSTAATTSESLSFSFSGIGSHAVPSHFELNGVTCAAAPAKEITSESSEAELRRRQATAQRTMGFIGCSMAENVAQGYVAVGGRRMWGPYGTGAMVVQSWTNANSASWRLFDQQATRNGKPTAVWAQICIFAQAGASTAEVRALITNARAHAAPGATIYISGQPTYDPGQTCFLAGNGGPELTDRLAKEAAADPTLNATYAGEFKLKRGEVQDGCHANQAGQRSLGTQAIGFFG